MGRDAFFSLLGNYGLLIHIRKRKARTTDSHHPYRKYPNLIKEFIPNINGLIHHSDRGVQYCCYDYVKILNKNHIKISMTENGYPLENAIAERVNGILKSELPEEDYIRFEQAQEAVAVAISTYNHLRPHNSIGNLTPFEDHSLNNGAMLKCLWKNYYQPKEKEVLMEA